MPAPTEHPASFPRNVSINFNSDGCTPTDELIDLLITARQNYDWPANTGREASQARVIALEAAVSLDMAVLNPTSAHRIIISVSEWARNNANSHAAILRATIDEQMAMNDAILLLTNRATAQQGIDGLSALPGIHLVIASKIYRFCCPSHGAAVDRHSSYFFNSLRFVGDASSTSFTREWANGDHNTSRLAVYQSARYQHNLGIYFESYLQVLECLANFLNTSNRQYTCAATRQQKTWMPADIEMAAYYWWACNGAR